MEPKQTLPERVILRKHALLAQETAAPRAAEISDAVVIKDDGIYFLSGADGQVPLRGDHGFGLYHQDCRYLSGYEVAVGGNKPLTLANSSEHCFEAILSLHLPPWTYGGRKTGSKVGMRWRRFVDGSGLALYDTFVFENFHAEEVAVPLEFAFRARFDDVFAVRGLLRRRPGRITDPGTWREGSLEFSYAGKDGVARRSTVRFQPEARPAGRGKARMVLRLRPRQTAEVHVTVALRAAAGEEARVPASVFRTNRQARRNAIEEGYRRWLARQTGVETDNEALNLLLERSQRDLQLLRTHLDGSSFFAAGLPWFATLFGRDSAITVLQTLMYHSGMAAKTLRLLARYQGRAVDPWRDEQPGKILHELRRGEMAAAGLLPHTPYYGTIDATMLFLILAAETLFWTGDRALYEELLPALDAALDWMERHGDSDGDGYIDYPGEVRDGHLINQGWKDSGNAIPRADGSAPEPPIALAEFQGYAYRAWRDMARVFRHHGREARAERLEARAEELRRRFNRDFWMEEEGCYALGFERGGRLLSAVASNAGHALWSGIADKGKARRTLRRLMAEDMNGGWGIRTLSTAARAYDPLSYHLGSVWPHENAFIAAGARAYGEDAAASRLFRQITDAALRFRDGRLPELFGGQARSENPEPVRYPSACHPQAWGAGTIPYLVGVFLGLEPDAFGKKLRIVRPRLPDLTESLVLRRVAVGDAEADLRFEQRGGKIKVDVLERRGKLTIEIVEEES